MLNRERFALDTKQAQAVERFRSGDFSGAIAAWNDVLSDLDRRAVGRLPYALCLFNIGASYLRMNMASNAAEQFETALEIMAKDKRSPHDERLRLRAECAYALAQAEQMREDFEEADFNYHDACHDFGDANEPRRRIEALLRWGHMHAQEGDLVTGVNLLSKARKEARASIALVDLELEADQAVLTALERFEEAD